MEPMSVTIGKMLGLLLVGLWVRAIHKERVKKRAEKQFKAQMKDAGFTETQVQEFGQQLKSSENNAPTNQG